jgi:hypothetical protein
VVSLPFKLIFFVLVDGWSLVAGSLVQSYGGWARKFCLDAGRRPPLDRPIDSILCTLYYNNCSRKMGCSTGSVPARLARN